MEYCCFRACTSLFLGQRKQEDTFNFDDFECGCGMIMLWMKPNFPNLSVGSCSETLLSGGQGQHMIINADFTGHKVSVSTSAHLWMRRYNSWLLIHSEVDNERKERERKTFFVTLCDSVTLKYELWRFGAERGIHVWLCRFLFFSGSMQFFS